MFRKIVFLSAISVSAVAFSQQNLKQKLGNYLDSLYAHQKMMGSFAIAEDGKSTFQHVVGFSDVDKKLKANINTQYRVGSISKTFTAVLMMKAVEENKIYLSQKLSDFYPEIPNAKKITIENLLQHRSGIHNLTDENEYLQYYTQKKSEKELIDIIKKYDSDFNPGIQFQYSNSNYILLGFILEKVYKKSFADLVKEKISKPLKLSLTEVGGKINSDKNQAKSYSFQNGLYNLAPETDMSIPIGAGDIISTPSELLKFILGLENGKLITKESLKKMQNFSDNYGYGLVKIPFNEYSGFGHTGGIDEFRSFLYYFPDLKIAVSSVTNQSDYDNNQFAVNMLKAATGKDFAMPEFKDKISPEVAVSVDILKKYEGIYKAEGFPLDIKIFVDGNILYGQATGQGAFPLKAVSETEFHFEMAGIEMKFDASKKTMYFSQKANKVTFTKQ
ncbi:serine hydrolase domain-containing protein [Chryseobacterium sp.]|uniref:serine hydrolase domain-containing protein n=1 Tax=Chryseobacterium sp. TaxID=1871047 RepID=UPI00289A5A0D|nr:serine hydrolase domain-containing protein [Chryseobacterium sp.]